MDNNLTLMWEIMGPGIAGAVFGAGWWFWVDAVVCSAVKVSFLHYLPGIFATLAALMFNCVSRDDVSYGYYSPYDDTEWRMLYFDGVGGLRLCIGVNPLKCRKRANYGPLETICFLPCYKVKLWLFVAYVVSFVSLAGAVGLLIQDALTDKGPSVWTGVAGVLQCVFVLISGLIYWTCHSED